ncbi:Hypothetical protein A7982_07448 [Minicystis rosea]|nr:Hypothetical protein A7982_07448 [Minicystis rosea]
MSKSHRKLDLSCGRTVHLEWLQQWSVYAGLLEGLPTRERNDADIEQWRADARRKDEHEPFLITPNQRPIEYDGHYPLGEPAALPAIGCIARFCSYEPARDPDKDYSALTVIWFQDDYAFPLSEEAEQAIRNLDWEKWARDWEH